MLTRSNWPACWKGSLASEKVTCQRSQVFRPHLHEAGSAGSTERLLLVTQWLLLFPAKWIQKKHCGRIMFSWMVQHSQYASSYLQFLDSPLLFIPSKVSTVRMVSN